MAQMQQHQRVLVVGATSSLAGPLCHMLAARGAELALAGRNKQELDKLASDITIRYGTKTLVIALDLSEVSPATDRVMERAEGFMGDIDTLVLVAGERGEGNKISSAEALDRMVRVNYTVPSLLMQQAAERMAKRKHGNIVVISSVAGDRGRQSNYPYGSSKAGLSAFADGLRNRMCREGVHVLNVKPGFVDTPMTYGKRSFLIASREMVAREIIKAMDVKKNTLYVPWYWRYIMLIIMNIPEFIFKKLKL